MPDKLTTDLGVIEAWENGYLALLRE